MALNITYQLRDLSEAKPSTHPATGTTDLCGVLQALVEDLLGVYLKAEKVHWHLQLRRQEEHCAAEADLLADVTQELRESVLNAILQLGSSMQSHPPGEDVSITQLINELANLQARSEGGDA
jgi:hypothetical protein